MTLKRVAKKQLTLSLIACTLTIFTVIGISVIGAPSLCTSADVLGSTLCVILMFSWYDPIVNKISGVLCCVCCESKKPIATSTDAPSSQQPDASSHVLSEVPSASPTSMPSMEAKEMPIEEPNVMNQNSRSTQM